MTSTMRTFRNGSALPLGDVPVLETESFLKAILDATVHGWRVSSYFGLPRGGGLRIYCLMSSDSRGSLGMAAADVAGNAFPSIAEFCPQIQMFEREVAEQFGVVFEDSPWPKPVRFERRLTDRTAAGCRTGRPSDVGVMEYYQVKGHEVHEVAVGPVHAGIIEPGHFRFQCYGEQVLHLEISLGYQHRGVERLVLGGPHPASLHQMETVAGDTTIGHGLAYAMVIEALSGTMAPARAHALRGVALELERLANHTGDLGAIAGDVGYLPTASFCGRIRGDFLNMTAELCGSRFGRGMVVPGGVGFDCGPELAETLLKKSAAARTDLANAVELLWETPSVMARLENTGPLTAEAARELGLVGPAARACGVNMDVRRDHTFGIYSMAQIPVATASTGDVHARTLVRWLEAEKSLYFIDEQLRHLPGGACMGKSNGLAGEHIAVALTEGWRGEVCHVAVTDDAGRFARYKVVDPSFHNWPGLAMALRGQQISDFPLCNKSFNLSYCGFDL
ncbi:MAG: NADH-quinone oxidoreductase subunit C [Nitrospirae bacterium]|nr:NADH-quinone oxidoreductase subunit C [Nitrospirota bacterium]